MRISDRYIGKQVLFGTFFAIAVLSLVLVLGNLFREIRPLLVEQRAPLGLIGRFLLNVLPFSLIFTIPWGFLSALLLVFGRMSSEQELTGFRVAGLSLTRLAAPVFLIAAVFSAVCLWLNVRVAPNARATMNDLLYQEFLRDPRALLDPGAVQSRFSNQKVFIEGREGDELVGFHLYQTRKSSDPNGPQPAYIHSGRVGLHVDQVKKEFRLTLDDAFIESHKNDGSVDHAFAGEAKYWYLGFSDSKPKRLKPSAMSNDQLRIAAEETLQLSKKEQGDKKDQKAKKSSKGAKDKSREYRSEITKRYSFSFACLAFAFIAIPLGITTRRRDNSSGLVLSLLIGAGYFLATSLADQFRSDTMVTVALWLPNVICVVVGVILFRRARFR
jgi:lipopolysaccharide export LptBFGC system permease protein LptF